MLFLKYLNGLQFFPPSLLFSTILISYLTWINVILNPSFVQSIRLKRPKSWTYGDIFLSQISQIQSKDFYGEGILKFLLQLDSITSERVFGSVVLIQNEYLQRWPFSKWPLPKTTVAQNDRYPIWSLLEMTITYYDRPFSRHLCWGMMIPFTYEFGRSCIFKHDYDVTSNKKLLAKIKGQIDRILGLITRVFILSKGLINL